jgi:hypothetical protein
MCRVYNVHEVSYRYNYNLDESCNNNWHAYFELISTTEVQYKAKRNEFFKIFHVASKSENCKKNVNVSLCLTN